MKLSILALTAFAASVVVAAPAAKSTISLTKHTPTDNTSRIERALSNKEFQIAKYAKHYKAGLKEAVSSNVPLTNDDNELYYGNVVIGSQTVTVDFDTGSSDFWVRGAKCTSSDDSCGTGSGHTGIKTTGLTDAKQKFDDGYGSGEASGEIWQGTYSVGGVSAKNAYLGISSKETGFDDPSDGLFGLAFSGLSNIGQATDGNAPIDALGLKSFAFYLSNDSSDKGELSLAGADSSKYTGAFNYVPLNAETYWQFSTSTATASVNGKSHKFTTKSAIADSGTTLVIVDDAVASSIYSAVGADSQGNISCSKASSAPAIVFTIAGKAYSIPASVWVFTDGSSCICGVQGGAADAGVVIFGDVFMRQYYTLFDITNKRLGFALSA
ncbi:hypothetical protein HKX48_008660 [Thoreauomyces humboldtii]|nr:hypothetical protein HKX48_008660 [Thoreauomyces humboldtii]